MHLHGEPAKYPWLPQVPRPARQRTPSTPTNRVRLPAQKSASTTTGAMYIYTKTGPAKYHDGPRRVWIRQLRRRIVPLRLPCTSTIAKEPCNGTVKFDYRRENDYFHYSS